MVYFVLPGLVKRLIRTRILDRPEGKALIFNFEPDFTIFRKLLSKCFSFRRKARIRNKHEKEYIHIYNIIIHTHIYDK